MKRRALRWGEVETALGSSRELGLDDGLLVSLQLVVKASTLR